MRVTNYRWLGMFYLLCLASGVASADLLLSDNGQAKLPIVTPVETSPLEQVVASVGVDRPTIIWASDPVQPGETVVVLGDGWSETVPAELARIADGEPRPRRRTFLAGRDGLKLLPIKTNKD